MSKRRNNNRANQPIYQTPTEHMFQNYYGEAALAGQKFSYNMNQNSAQEQMKFQDYMSSTAHQREVGDLIAAGLNPVLSANNGAATGAGAYASVDNTATSGALQKQLISKQLNWQSKQNNLDRQMNMIIAQRQIDNQNLINKYAVDRQYDLGVLNSTNNLLGMKYSADANSSASRYGSRLGYLASIYGTDTMSAANRYAALLSAGAQRYSADATRYAAGVSAAAQRYAAQQAAGASKYASDNQLLNNREQRTFDNMHPSNVWELGGSLTYGMYGLAKNAIENYNNYGNFDYFNPNSSAK